MSTIVHLGANKGVQNDDADYSISIGAYVNDTNEQTGAGLNSVAIGAKASAGYTNSIALGYEASTYQPGQLAIKVGKRELRTLLNPQNNTLPVTITDDAGVEQPYNIPLNQNGLGGGTSSSYPEYTDEGQLTYSTSAQTGQILQPISNGILVVSSGLPTWKNDLKLNLGTLNSPSLSFIADPDSGLHHTGGGIAVVKDATTELLIEPQTVTVSNRLECSSFRMFSSILPKSLLFSQSNGVYQPTLTRNVGSTMKVYSQSVNTITVTATDAYDDALHEINFVNNQDIYVNLSAYTNATGLTLRGFKMVLNKYNSGNFILMTTGGALLNGSIQTSNGVVLVNNSTNVSISFSSYNTGDIIEVFQLSNNKIVVKGFVSGASSGVTV